MDARISTGLPSHPKTKKLARRLGAAGPLGCIYLFLWAAANRSDGDLTGMTDEDIELAIDWAGEEGAFVAAMAEVGFLDGAERERSIHDWAEHNPWAAGAEARADKARWAALCRRQGRKEAARLMPEYAARLPDALLDDASGADGAVPDSASSRPVAASSSAPSPSPSPSPNPEDQEHSPLPPKGGEGGEEDAAAAARRKASREEQRLREIAEQSVAAYNDLLATRPHGLLSQCRLITAKRLRALRSALPTVRAICLQEFGAERVEPAFWQALFQAAAEDPFHSGRQPGGAGHEGWKPDWDFLIRPAVITRLFERALSAAEADAGADGDTQVAA